MRAGTNPYSTPTRAGETKETTATFQHCESFALNVEQGSIDVREVLLPASDAAPKPRKVSLAGREVPFHARRQDAGLWQVHFTADVRAHAGETLAIT